MDSKRLFLAILFSLILFPLVSSADVNLDVEKQSSGETLVVGTETPVTFDLKLTNRGEDATFEFYNLLGFSMEPDKVSLNTGQSKTISIKITPLGEVKERGLYSMSYYVKRSTEIQEQKYLTFKIVELKDIFSIGSEPLDPESSSVEIFIKNNEAVNFQKIDAKFNSPFFKVEKSFSLSEKEIKTFDIPLHQKNGSSLIAGFYTMTANLKVGDQETDLEGTIKFVEKGIVTTTGSEFGFLVTTQLIKKLNEGNVVQKTEIFAKKNIISRLFTSFNIEPDSVEREGTSIRYTWIREIQPGKSLEIKVRTNWLFPFIIILFIVVIVFMTKKYTETSLVMRKKVSFVRAKGGEFALKVSIFVSSKKYLERVNIIDRLPPLVDVYERFGGEQPSKIDKKNKKIEWNFEKLEAGERRMLSYVVYSKVGILGRFALPSATAIFEKEGVIHESESNRAFFVNEARSVKSDEEN